MRALAVAAVAALSAAAARWPSEIVHEWRTLDFDWPDARTKADALRSGAFRPRNNALAGIKVDGDEIYVTVPRWRPGVPASLNRLRRGVGSPEEPPVLQPWPSWEANRLGDCTALQYVQSMELVPQSREMWIIDVGRADIFSKEPRNLCPPKLVIADLDTGQFLSTYNFSEEVVSASRNFLNDIVVDPRLRVAYMSNPMEISLVVYDDVGRRAWKFSHESMNATVTQFKVGGTEMNNSMPIDGVALSPDWGTLFYCALAGTKLYSVSTSVLRDPTARTADFNRAYKLAGNKHAETDGMVMSADSLYYGAVSDSTVMRWKIGVDMEKQGASYLNVLMKTTGLLRKDEATLQWPDTFAIDAAKNLWFVTNRINLFFSNNLDFDGDANFRIWRVAINESSYLSQYSTSAVSASSTCLSMFCFTILISSLCLLCH